MSCDKLPDLPVADNNGSAQKAQSITADKQEDSEPIPEYFPPLPIYPPEEVNPVEAALNSFIEETNSEQNSSVQREEQFVNDVNVPVAPPAVAPFIADNTDSGIAESTLTVSRTVPQCRRTSRTAIQATAIALHSDA